jgi:hypothetical protein
MFTNPAQGLAYAHCTDTYPLHACYSELSHQNLIDWLPALTLKTMFESGHVGYLTGQ